MRRLVDLMLVILPFEEELYKAAGVHVEFVGHPLMDHIPSFTDPRTSTEQRNVGLLPGSREVEVKRILPIMTQTARLILGDFPNTRFFLPLASGLSESRVRKLTKDLDVSIVPSPAYEARYNADFALTASGTATLENAILGLPMAVIYKLSLPTYLIGRALIRIDKIGLVNIVAQRSIVPEFIQFAAKPSLVATYARAFFNDPTLQDEVRKGLHEVRQALGEPGASKRAATHVLERIG